MFNDPNYTVEVDFNPLADTAVNDNSIYVEAQQVPLNLGGFERLSYENGNLALTPKRTKNNPVPTDKTLAPNDPRQRFDDSRTIDGWINVVDKLMHAAWEDENGRFPIVFTQDYALLPQDPDDINEVVIVYHQVSKVPAMLGSHREIKPRVREVRYRTALEANSQVGGTGVGEGVEYIWAQSFDMVIAFTVYGKDWKTMHTWYQKLEAFMATYTFYWMQTGLQQFVYREQTSDGLFDPPHNEEFPNRTVYYNVRIEQQTRVPYVEIEQVLIKAGVINPATGVSTNAVVVTVDGIPESPVLPGPSGLSG